ncbi:Protein of unknown function [Pyronema omphalodes CBS 100304]|uniref:Uncharacterized protein n=1 Tax=Pyronema omphalodes (strain CBS 100304) TaxID=1076935 RepID=U4LS15_PYROM|nr:Protein of unknown function [Pyronema omphalodes CBS 100304]
MKSRSPTGWELLGDHTR